MGHGESGLGTYDVSHERVIRVGLGHELLNGSQQGCNVEGWSPGTLDRHTDRQTGSSSKNVLLQSHEARGSTFAPATHFWWQLENV